MKWNSDLIGDDVAEATVTDRGGRWSVEVLTADCRVFRLRPEFECGGRKPTREDVGRVFARERDNFEEVK